MTTIYYSFVALSALIALSDFRRGIYFAIFIDLLRDIVRKTDPSESVLITVAGAAVWGAVFLGATKSYPGLVSRAFSEHPLLRKSISTFLIGLVPAAGLAVILYPGGYKMAVVGGVSFVVPLFGLAIGYALPRQSKDIYGMLAFYIFVNAVFLIGVPLEHLGYDWAGLGGMRGMNWIRYRSGYTVDLISGFYRSPDIMGLHAASVAMFCFCFYVRADGRPKAGWIAIASWAFFCLFLAGRRKMIGMPFVFVAAWFFIGKLKNLVPANRMLGFLASLALPVGVSLLMLGRGSDNDAYADFASSLITEGGIRANELISNSVLGTIHQTGVFGAGLGSATQGRYHMGGISGPRAWQEDGISRIFMELGLFGVICVVIAGKHFYFAVKRAMGNPLGTFQTKILQLSLVSMVLAYGASFTISHQQFSGDPGSGVIVMILMGAVFGLYVPARREFVVG
ncbi:hypothetical protein Pla52o_10260 [Novipirellula galeiformis]|uniref:O-Antigen ligase n=1 Tax=Novipirellula galeiformis TaxID=2528004 RepID=A0A5C6CRP6_9BACT|nr:hypothetical protein Pla52o_10260 [Novipirellula galeiformis]